MEAEEHNSNQPVQSPVIQAKRVSFSDKLKECGSPTDVLDLVSLYTATSRRVSNCLTRIWSIHKTMTEEQQRVELGLMFEHAGFEELLNTIMLEAGRMRSLDLAYSLLAMVKLGVSPSSRVVQTLLRVSQVTHPGRGGLPGREVTRGGAVVVTRSLSILFYDRSV